MSHVPKIEWDGNCKNSKAEGIGKISSINGSINHYEITYLNKGITDQFFYKWIEGTNQIHYGSYVHENGKMIKLMSNTASTKENGEIQFVFSMIEQSLITGISQGIVFKQYLDGYAKYTGKFGNLLFFGAREAFDRNNTPTVSYWGYYDVGSDKPENYVIFKNTQGIWHQLYKYGGLQEYIQLPTSFINDINKTSGETTKIANDVANAGLLALAMKKKYDNLTQNSLNVEKNQPRKKYPKEEAKQDIATGTGFFISDDGYVSYQ